MHSVALWVGWAVLGLVLVVGVPALLVSVAWWFVDRAYAKVVNVEHLIEFFRWKRDREEADRAE